MVGILVHAVTASLYCAVYVSVSSVSASVNGVSAWKTMYIPTYGVGYYKANYLVRVLLPSAGAVFLVSMINS